MTSRIQITNANMDGGRNITIDIGQSQQTLGPGQYVNLTISDGVAVTVYEGGQSLAVKPVLIDASAAVDAAPAEDAPDAAATPAVEPESPDGPSPSNE